MEFNDYIVYLDESGDDSMTSIDDVDKVETKSKLLAMTVNIIIQKLNAENARTRQT